MEDESIDYKAMYEHMVNELEQARIAILDLRRTRGLSGLVSTDAARSWVSRNYLLIVVGVMLGTFIVSSLKTLIDLLKTPPPKEGGTNGFSQ
jgi:hypothetical protein